MPATMASANTRTTRSRYSSPHQTPNGTSTEPGKGNASGSTPVAGTDGPQQKFMRSWLEPPLNSKASYQDAGLVRHGVVEGMAPLGTMPKVGLFKKTSGPVLPPPEKTATPIRRIVLKRPAPATPPPAVLNAAPPAPEADETEEEEEDEEDTVDRQQDYGDDDMHRLGLTRQSLLSRDDMDEDWIPGKGPSFRGFYRRSASRASGGRLGSISSSSYQQTPASRLADLKETADQVVENAVDEALALYRYPTAWALRTLYDEKSDDPEFLGLVTRIFRQQADREDLEDFARMMTAKKKEAKKDNKGCYYFVPPSTNSLFPPHPPRPAPYGHLINFDLSILHQDPNQDPEPESEQEPEQEPELDSQPKPESKTEAKVEPETEAETEGEAGAEREPEVQAEPEPAPEREVEQAEAKPEPDPETVIRRVGKRELPCDGEQQEEAEAGQETHVRKKRRSNRQSASAAKMAQNAGSGKTKTSTPSKRSTRANSQSSTSTLSPARSVTPPDGIPEDEDDADAYEPPASRTSPTASRIRKAAAAFKPTRKGRRSLAQRKAARASAVAERDSPKASSTAATQDPAADSEQSPQTPQQTAIEEPAATEQPYDMPAVVDAPTFPNTKKGAKSGANGVVFPSKVGKIDDNDPKFRLRQSARAVTNSHKTIADESFTRDAPSAEGMEMEPTEPAVPAPASRARGSGPAARPTPAPANTRSTRSSRKRSHDELEEQPSPTVINFAASEAAPSTAVNSRAGTPALRTAKKPRTGLRVKNSPMKKKGGTSAGIPRASGERSSPGIAQKEDDNDDYCASCGGNGELICCDGCTRSFHFNCVDPPLVQESMPVEWFCNVCRSSRDHAAPSFHSGPFALLIESLDGKNSSAFRLPADVRELFEGVRTGPDGEYEDVVTTVKPTRKKKNDEDAVPDFFRLRDTDGNPAICHACQKSTAANRAIIPCSVCGLYWHLDCLDPPLANPPPLRTWKCPCHIDEVLAKVPGTLGPAHRHRKIKNAPVIQPAFSRGYINNGYIEVELAESDDESGWKDVETYGRTVRLPEKGIKLDFLARARANRKGKRIPPLSHAESAAALVAPSPPLDRAIMEHQQAAHNLVLLSGQGTSGVDYLIDALLSGATPSIISLMARADPGRLAGDEPLKNLDQQSLRAMLAQLERTSSQIRQLLNPSTPEQATPLPAAGSSGAAQEQPGRVPSLTLSQTDAESETPQLDSKEKTPPSPAASDDVASTSRLGDSKALTPIRDADDQLGGSSPADEKSTADKDDMPVTPTDSRMIADDDAVIVKEPQSDKTAVEIEDDGMDLD